MMYRLLDVIGLFGALAIDASMQSPTVFTRRRRLQAGGAAVARLEKIVAGHR